VLYKRYYYYSYYTFTNQDQLQLQLLFALTLKLRHVEPDKPFMTLLTAGNECYFCLFVS